MPWKPTAGGVHRGSVEDLMKEMEEMHRYLVVIENAGDNYSAYCPDLPGVIATGRTPEETMKSMKEAIEFHIDGLIEEGLSIDGRWEALGREKNDYARLDDI